MSDVYETRDVEHNGTTYRVEFEYDHDMGAPWDEHAGHGVISDGNRQDKKPGEIRIDLGEGFSRPRFYDVQETIKLATRDGWGLSAESVVLLSRKLGRTATRKECTVESVRQDMERMREWLCNVWHWCGISVFPLTADGDELRSKTKSLWGIESDAGDYFDEVISELIGQIA